MSRSVKRDGFGLHSAELHNGGTVEVLTKDADPSAFPARGGLYFEERVQPHRQAEDCPIAIDPTRGRDTVESSIRVLKQGGLRVLTVSRIEAVQGC